MRMKPSPSGPKLRARRRNDVCLAQQAVEEIPGRHAVRRFGPDVGAVDAAVNRESRGAQTLADDAGVIHIVGDEGLIFPLALLGVDGLRRALDDVGGAVELRRLAAEPDIRKLLPVAFEAGGDGGVAAAGAGEAGGLGEAAKFDRALSRAFDLVDRVWDVRLRDVLAIGGIVEDERVVAPRVVYPDLELGLAATAAPVGLLGKQR